VSRKNKCATTETTLESDLSNLCADCAELHKHLSPYVGRL